MIASIVKVNKINKFLVLDVSIMEVWYGVSSGAFFYRKCIVVAERAGSC